jgi:acyl-CoA-binding protein
MASSTSIDDNFDAATTYVASLAANGDVPEADLLTFYGLFKQATEGPCETAKPAFFDLKKRAKWAAWKHVGDISPEEARTAYIDLLTSIKPEWNQGASSKNKTGGGAGGGVFSSLAHFDHDDELENDDKVNKNTREKFQPAALLYSPLF